jgi:hypothetical protein
MGMFSDIDYSLIVLQLEKAMANGVATLDSNTKVPKAQISLTASDVGAIASTGNEVLTSLNAASGTISSGLLPSYVDDVLSYTNLAGFPGTGETGKIYVDETTNKVYRWSGSVYVEISSSATAGEALKLSTPRTIATTGDASYSVSFDGSANVTSAITLATVNSNTGSFGSASSIPAITVNAKGQVTAVSTNSIGNELIAIQSLSDTPGFLKKTGDGTYSIDINSYLSLAGGTLTGALIATSFSGVGTALTALNASNISTGTINAARLPAAYLPLTGGTVSSAVLIQSATQFNGFAVSNGSFTVAQLQGSSAVNDNGTLTLRNTGTATINIVASGVSYFNGGNVGFGGSNPSYPLDVFGDSRFSGVANFTNATQSTSPTTGASRVTGGQGIGGNQYVGGFSSLGGDANHPGVKIKVLTGTTAATQGGIVSIPHGVAHLKITSVSIMVLFMNQWIPHSYTLNANYQFNFVVDSTNIIVLNFPENSAGILSKPLIITIIYTA